MIFFLLGVVVGGLSLWVYMREHVLRIEAEIAAVTAKRLATAASAPPVKTRKIGEGSSKSSKKAAAKPEPKAKPAPEPESEPEEADDEEDEAADEPEEAEAAAEGADDAEASKPKVNLKLNAPSADEEE